LVTDVWKSIKKQQFQSIYLLFGNEPFLINETKRLMVDYVLQPEELDFNLSVFDLEETPVEVALEEAETLPFMGEKRIVFLHNPVFLTAEKTKEKVEHDVKRLEQYIDNPAPFSIVVIVAPYEKLDERKKITKELKRKAAVVEAKKLSENELMNWIQERVITLGIAIDNEAAQALVALNGTNLMMLSSEIDKMVLFVGENGRITLPIVEKLVSKSFEQNVFTLVEKILNRNVAESIEILQELIRQNEEPIKIVSIMAGQIRLLYQVKELANQGYPQQRIAGLLKVHPYRVKLAMEKTRMFQTKELLYLINELADADYKMKTGQMDKSLLMELIILKLHRAHS
jgi:DNA polymerase III subunit delta